MMFRFKAIVTIIALISIVSNVYSQTETISLNKDSIIKPVEVEVLNHNKHHSCFSIAVSDTVKPHYHAKHIETLYVIKGNGILYIGSEKFYLKQGDYISIPQGAIHSYKNTHPEFTQVLSIQAPKFEGKDRIWVEKQE